MFLCQSCVIPSARWKFDIRMNVSRGTCEVCKTGPVPCIDCLPTGIVERGDFVIEDKQLEFPRS